MPVSVDAVLYGSTSPQHVQVVVSGLTVGDVVSIVGFAAGATWQVRGAVGASAVSTSFIARDVAAPINTPITYQATVNGVGYGSSAVTVPHTTDYVLQSLDGRTTVAIDWADNGLPMDISVDQHFSTVPGRSTRVLRWAPAGVRSGEWQLETDGTAVTEALIALVGASAPVWMRTNGALRDFPPTMLVALSGPSLALVGAIGQLREWKVKWERTADPLAYVGSPSWTLADMDAVVTDQGGTLADLDTFVAALGGTFEDIDAFDWESEAIA